MEHLDVKSDIKLYISWLPLMGERDQDAARYVVIGDQPASKLKNMYIVKAAGTAIVFALVAAMMVLSAGAQQPDAAARQPTHVAPLNPNWCSDVPASPPPPYFEHHPGEWAEARQLCMSARKMDRGCMNICGNAEERWSLQKAGRLNQPNTFPSPTDQPQGPFPLPGGGSGYILPAQPAPAPGGPG